MTLIDRTISSENLKTFLVSQGVPAANIMLLGSLWECAEPADIDSAIAPASDALIKSLEIVKPSGDGFLLSIPYCVQYSDIARMTMLLTTIRQKEDCSKAFGLFGYIPDGDRPLHCLCWSVHTRQDRSLYLVHREPQRSLRVVSLSQKEIESCVALFAC